MHMPATPEWRTELRRILRNTASSTIRTWCREAGITKEKEMALTAYAENISVDDMAQSLGMERRSYHEMRLCALKQLRSFLASKPDTCRAFTAFLAENRQKDLGPTPQRPQKISP